MVYRYSLVCANVPTLLPILAEYVLVALPVIENPGFKETLTVATSALLVVRTALSTIVCGNKPV